MVAGDELKLALTAGQVAAARGWDEPELVYPEQVSDLRPIGEPVIVIAARAITKDEAKAMAALAGAGRDIVLVTNAVQDSDALSWLPPSVLNAAFSEQQFDLGAANDVESEPDLSAFGLQQQFAPGDYAGASRAAALAEAIMLDGKIISFTEADFFPVKPARFKQDFVESVAACYGRFLRIPPTWSEGDLVLDIATPLGNRGTIRLRHTARTHSGEPCLRILVSIPGSRSQRATTNANEWDDIAQWALRKAESYYLNYTGLSETAEERAEKFAQSIALAGMPVPGPLSDRESLCQLNIDIMAVHGAFPGEIGGRIWSRHLSSGPLCLGWDISEEWAEIVMIAYGHRATVGLIDIANANRLWLSEAVAT